MVRPACDKAKVYEEKTRNREMCRLKCYLSSIFSEFNSKVLGNILDLVDSKTSLDDCLDKCPKSPPRGCDKECCNQRDMIIQRRKLDRKACCGGHRRVNINNVSADDVIDCRTSHSSCKKGFLLLFSNNNTVCVNSNSRSDLGLDFNFSDECWGLYDLQDTREKYWKDLD